MSIFHHLRSKPNRVAVDLRRTLTKPSLLFPTSTSLYSTSSQPKSPRKPRTQQQQQPSEQQSPKSWVTFNTASGQLDKMMTFEEQDEKMVVELDERKWSKPSEIPWQAKVANCVNLIGHIKMPIQFRSDDDGKKSFAASVIRQEISPKSNPLWIPVLFEGDLAHVVACHVKENDHVYVAGHLSAEPSPFDPIITRQSLQLIVESINFVDEPSRIKKYVSHTRKKDDTRSDDNTSIKQSWRDLLLKPQEWWDVRLDKGNATGAAFKHKDNSELLFIDELTPQWLLRKLECLTFDQQITETKLQTAGGRIHDASLGPWKDLLDNTEQWRDYRKDKLDGNVSAKYPDFKRKDRSVSLWLNQAPKYILSELDDLDFGVPSSSPQPAQPAKRSKGENLWKDVVENPKKWWDNRLKKLNKKSPDFKHKDTGEGLWLSDAPAWILSKLPPSKPTPSFVTATKESMMIS